MNFCNQHLISASSETEALYIAHIKWGYVTYSNSLLIVKAFVCAKTSALQISVIFREICILHIYNFWSLMAKLDTK